MEAKHVALYCRTSTTLQSTGLEAQILALRNYCVVQGNFVILSYMPMKGISGTKAHRPELDRLMAAVGRGEVSSVIVYSFSRFARSVTHLLEGLQTFESRGVSVCSRERKPRHANQHRQVCIYYPRGALGSGTRKSGGTGQEWPHQCPNKRRAPGPSQKPS